MISLISRITSAFRKRQATRWALSQLPDLVPGDLCSHADGDGSFGVAKVLAVDSKGVHLRLYREKFKFRPAAARTADLSLGGMDDPEGFGMSHIPLSKVVFGSWQPIKIGSEPVSEEELEGYRLWLEAKGGYWE